MMVNSSCLDFLPLCLLLSAVGCRNETCSPGARGCPCAMETLCFSRPGERLICDEGFCAIARCDQGSQGCDCYDNGTCDALEGTPMSCLQGVCAPTVLPDPGTLGGACSDSTACVSSASLTLECVSGRCEIAGCPTGAIGCPCEVYGQCGAYMGRDVRCIAERCAIVGCESGTAGCQCSDQGACDEGAMCIDRLCRSSERIAIEIVGRNARACDLVIEGGSADEADVRFASFVQGAFATRDSLIAISLISRSDEGLGPVPAFLELQRSAAPVFRLREVTCFDRLGHPMAGVSARIE